MSNVPVDPATEIYEVAQKDMQRKMDKAERLADAGKIESYADGALDAFGYMRSSNEIQEYAILHRVKQEKEYKKEGLTWKQFCDRRGLNVRNVDRALDDMRPLFKEFSDKCLILSGLSFNKIRYLGRSKSDNLSEITENGIQVSDDMVIPLDADHKDDIEAYINTLKRAEKETKEEGNKDLAAKQRVIKTLHETISGQEDKLSKFERSTPGEESTLDKEQMKGLNELKGQFELFSVGMGLGVNLYLYKASDKVKAEYFANITYARQMIERLWGDAGNDLGWPTLPGAGEGEEWEPAEWQGPESNG